jgi:hypothetical protein
VVSGDNGGLCKDHQDDRHSGESVAAALTSGTAPDPGAGGSAEAAHSDAEIEAAIDFLLGPIRMGSQFEKHGEMLRQLWEQRNAALRAISHAREAIVTTEGTEIYHAMEQLGQPAESVALFKASLT